MWRTVKMRLAQKMNKNKYRVTKNENTYDEATNKVIFFKYYATPITSKNENDDYVCECKDQTDAEFITRALNEYADTIRRKFFGSRKLQQDLSYSSNDDEILS